MKELHNESATDSLSSLDALELVFAFAVATGGFMEAGLAAHGLTRARATLMWQIHRLGPMTQSQLAQTLAVTARNVTGLVDGLETAGFVVRRPHPEDRRATLVTLTDTGRAVTDHLEADYAEASARLFAGLSPADLQRFTTTLDLVMRRLTAETTGHPR